MSSKLDDYLVRHRRIAHYDPESNLPEGLVTHSHEAHWIGE